MLALFFIGMNLCHPVVTMCVLLFVTETLPTQTGLQDLESHTNQLISTQSNRRLRCGSELLLGHIVIHSLTRKKFIFPLESANKFIISLLGNNDFMDSSSTAMHS